MDLKSAHFQECDFQETGEVDMFLKVGTHFQERWGSLENGLCVYRKIRTHLDLLSIAQLEAKKMSKRLGGIKGCNYKTSSWHLNGFRDGSNIGSTV